MVGKNSLTLEEVKTTLYTRELRHKATSDNENYGIGLIDRSSINSRKKKGFSNSNSARSDTSNSTNGCSNTRTIICYHYQESGHFRFKFLELKNKSQVTVVESKQNQSYDLEDDLALISCVDYSDLFDSCILDYGSSFHMSPRRDWFDTYESCFGGSVTIANGNPCEVVDIGSMRLQTSDWRRVTLAKVKHVPTLGKLISLGTLDDLVLKCEFSNREVSFFKGSNFIYLRVSR